MSDKPSATPQRKRRKSMLTGKIIPRCACGKAVYAEGRCYAHYQASK